VGGGAESMAPRERQSSPPTSVDPGPGTRRAVVRAEGRAGPCGTRFEIDCLNASSSRKLSPPAAVGKKPAMAFNQNHSANQIASRQSPQTPGCRCRGAVRRQAPCPHSRPRPPPITLPPLPAAGGGCCCANRRAAPPTSRVQARRRRRP